MKSKSLKRGIIGILALSMISLTACSEKTQISTSPEVKETDKPASDVTIQIFQSKVEINDALEAMAQEYTELTGIKIEVLGATGDDFYTNLVAKLNSNQGPTIFSMSEGDALEDLNSFLYDLSDQPYIVDIAEGQALVYDDKVLGVPYGVEGFGLVYNKDLVDPSKMSDSQSLSTYSSELANAGTVPIQLSDKSNFLIGHLLNVPFALQPDYKDYIEKLNNGEVKMSETPEFQDWAKIMESIRSTSNNPMAVTYDDQIAGFATEQTAMIHQGNWVYGMFNDYNVPFEMSIAPVPVMGNQKLSVGMSKAWCINANADPTEIEEALNFFEWFFTSERGKEYIADEFGFIPALKSIEADSLDPLAQAVLDASNSGNTIPWAFRYWPAGLVDNYLLPVGQKFFSSKDMTGQELLEALDKAWLEGNANPAK